MTGPSRELEKRWELLRAEPTYSRLAPSTIRAGLWAAVALLRARRKLRRDGLETRVLPPPSLPWGSRAGVNGVLQRTSPTCLERCLVMQSWLLSHGVAHDVVVGVGRTAGGPVTAHAWLEHITDPREFQSYREIHRIPAS